MSSADKTKIAPRPFIPRREAMLCCPNSEYWNNMTPALKQRFFMPYWTEERLRHHLLMLKAFGFNAIQLTAAGQVAMNSGVSQEAWKEKLRLICRLAKELDLGIAQFVWGTCFYDGTSNQYVRDLDWHVEADRNRMEQFFEDESFLAPWVDRVVTHWLDPGGPKKGCPQCNIDTAIEIHNVILATFARKNPKIEGSFSNWFMGDDKSWGVQWRDYAGAPALANHPALGRQSGIALGRQNFIMDGTHPPSPEDRVYVAYIQASDLEAIQKAGRRAGAWCWYTTDLEIFPSLHVHTDLLQNFFQALPPQAGSLLDYMSVEDNSHGLNMQNLYVAAHLMQDPRQEAHLLLADFVRGFLGERNRAPVVQGLRAIELVRCRSLRYAPKQGGCALAPSFINQSPWFYPEWIQENQARVNQAIADLAPVSIDPAFQPAWPVTMSPTDYLAELKAHLVAIHYLLAFLKEAVKIDQRKQAGLSGEPLEAAIQKLPVVTHDPTHTAGLEFAVYQRTLNQLQSSGAAI